MLLRLRTRSDRLSAEISALADGSIPPERRRPVERQIEGSAELRRRFEQERMAVEMLRQARERDRAPESLRRRIEREWAARSEPGSRQSGPGLRRSGPVLRGSRPLASSLAVAAAVVAAILVLLIAGGPTAGPSVAQAAVLATRGATAPGPRVDPRDPQALLQRVGAVSFPNWSYTLGWNTTGQRIDRLDHHLAVTVYYSWHGRDVAYTIVSVPALAEPHASVVRTGGLHLRVLWLTGRRIVTWRRDGRTCVLSSRDVPAAQLESLAAWS
jgi:hypothetical protein